MLVSRIHIRISAIIITTSEHGVARGLSARGHPPRRRAAAAPLVEYSRSSPIRIRISIHMSMVPAQ